MSDIISYERDTAVGNLTHEFLLSMASHDLSVFYCVTDITVTTKATYLFTVTISSLCFIHIQLCVCVFFQKVCVDIKQEVLAPSGEAILLILTAGNHLQSFCRWDFVHLLSLWNPNMLFSSGIFSCVVQQKKHSTTHFYIHHIAQYTNE